MSGAGWSGNDGSSTSVRCSGKRHANLPGRFRPQFRDKNRRDTGKSQSIWTDSKMETAGSRARGRRRRVTIGIGIIATAATA
eukprot:COSAG01_NODE_3166_length_6474_cov_287.238431_3_plen_82_part_00